MEATYVYDDASHFAHSCALLTSRSTGKERDSESGNDYFEARYYGSSMGRMLSPDPIGGDMTNPQSLNKYGRWPGHFPNRSRESELLVCAPFIASFAMSGEGHRKRQGSCNIRPCPAASSGCPASGFSDVG